MSDRPILFMDSMVRAILDGRKDVTRRCGLTWAKVQPATRLWVREAWAPADDLIGLTAGYVRDPPSSVVFRADNHAFICNAGERPIRADDRNIIPPKRWRPSIHMPRWACRLELEVVSVTEDRGFPVILSDAEARREGFTDRNAFLVAWSKMHPDHTGPVYRVAFRRAA